MKNEIQELRETTCELLTNITIRIDSLYEEYAAGGEEAYERIVFLIDDLKDVTDAVSLLEETVLDLDELNEKLNMLVEGVSNQDTMLIGDILMFELKPLLEEWQNHLS